jgi:hypothetical protein
MSKEDAGNLPLSSIYSDNGVYNIPCGSINWQSFVFARADTSTDIDVLLQPPSTAIVLIYKILEMLGSNDVGLACYSRLPHEFFLTSHLYVCVVSPVQVQRPAL